MNFKDTEIGRIPFEWDVRMIQDVAEVVSGATPKTKVAEYWDGNIAWITPKDLSNHTERYIYRGDRMITDEGLKNSSAKLLPKGSVLFSSRAPIGYTAIAAQELCTNQGFKSMICNQQILDNNFMFYMMNYKKNEIENIAGGSTFKEVSGKTVKEFKIPIPPLDEQKAIAKVLSDLDEKIETNNKINKKLEEMAQAIFKQWFVDFEFPNEDGKPYKSSGGEMVESELGMIPKGWSIEDLSNLMYFQEGPGIRNWQYVEENGIKFINIKCIKNNDLDISTANMISNEEAEGKYSHFMIDERDIVMSCSGTLGKYAIVRKEHLPLCLNTSVIRFKPLKDSKYYSYIYSYLTSRVFYEKLITMACGSVQANFGPTHLKKIRMISPSVNIIKKYNNLVLSLINKISLTRSENDKLTNTRNTLLPKLMSGEIRVPID